MNDQVLNIQFVQEVEKNPCLYNYKLTEYSRKDVTEKAWREVGKKVNLTESQSKEKWKNLRAVFVRHMKSARTGSSTKKKKTYYLTDAMQFTIPFIKTLNSVSENLSDVQYEETTDNEGNEDFCSTEQSNQPHSPLTPYLSPPSMPSPLPTLTTLGKPDDVLDSRKMFLLSLLHDVNSMTDTQMRTFKRKVLAVIDEIFEEPKQKTQNLKVE